MNEGAKGLRSKDYQEDAVDDVLANLRKARKRWHEDRDKQAFSLTATTGAGKTVMAAAAIEALFYGSADFEFEPDPGAVVIWFSDDPSLNEQSKYRLMEASDKLTVSDLITVENSFGRERFEPGKVYFLNTHKLSRNSLLVRGHDDDEDAIVTDGGRRLLPDARSHTIWDTIQNTIEDPELTLYLVLDEAHRGMRGTATGRQTIVTRLIGGQGRISGIPIVWGISATVERFDKAIRDIPGLSTLPNVLVDAKKVQDSGLLKDTIMMCRKSPGTLRPCFSAGARPSCATFQKPGQTTPHSRMFRNPSSRSWCCKCLTPRTMMKSVSGCRQFFRNGRSLTHPALQTSLATTEMKVLGHILHLTSRRSVCRTPNGCASLLPRMRSVPVGIAHVRKSWCRSARRRMRGDRTIAGCRPSRSGRESVAP